MDRDCVNKGGLDLSKEVLWGSVGQRTEGLATIKFGGLNKKFCHLAQLEPESPALGRAAEFFFKTLTLIAGSSVALQPTETHSTSLERSKPPLLTQALSKSLESLLMYFMSVQKTLITIVLI